VEGRGFRHARRADHPRIVIRQLYNHDHELYEQFRLNAQPGTCRRALVGQSVKDGWRLKMEARFATWRERYHAMSTTRGLCSSNRPELLVTMTVQRARRTIQTGFRTASRFWRRWLDRPSWVVRNGVGIYQPDRDRHRRPGLDRQCGGRWARPDHDRHCLAVAVPAVLGTTGWCAATRSRWKACARLELTCTWSCWAPPEGDDRNGRR